LETGLLGPLTVPDGAARAGELKELSRRAAVYATRARGDGTPRAYRPAWRHYAAWCARFRPLAPDRGRHPATSPARRARRTRFSSQPSSRANSRLLTPPIGADTF
jgi:hypothetical protein